VGNPFGATVGRADQQPGVVGGDRGRPDEDRVGGGALGVDPVEVLGVDRIRRSGLASSMWPSSDVATDSSTYGRFTARAGPRLRAGS
jgi:hypothetical protein